MSLSESLMNQPTASQTNDTLLQISLDFAQAVRRHPSTQDIFTLVADYEQILNDNLLVLGRQYGLKSSAAVVGLSGPLLTGNSSVDQVLNLIRTEFKTWKLISVLIRERVVRIAAESPPSIATNTASLSDFEIIKELYTTSTTFSELYLIRTWLEETFATFNMPADQMPTISSLPMETQQILEDGRVGQVGQGRLVTELDPSAAIRLGLQWHPTDAKRKSLFNQLLFYLLRSGRFERVSEVCLMAGEPMKAAIFDGSLLYHDANYETDELGSDGLVDVCGNQHRRIWKKVAKKTALNGKLPTMERAIYSVLTGLTEPLLPVCRSWDDVLWTFVVGAIERRVDWQVEQFSAGGNGMIVGDQADFDEDSTLESAGVAGKDRDISAVFERANQSAGQLGLEQSKIEELQQALITSNYDGAIHICQDLLTTQNDKTNLAEHAILLLQYKIRFVAHMLLFLHRLLGDELKDDVLDNIVNSVVATYVQQLGGDPMLKLYAALYTSLMPSRDKQIDCYVRFILEHSTGIEDRKTLLAQASEDGLDAPLIVDQLLDRIRLSGVGDSQFNESFLSVMKQLTQAGGGGVSVAGVTGVAAAGRGGGDHVAGGDVDVKLPVFARDLLAAADHLADSDKAKIESLDLIFYEEADPNDVLRKCNALMRQFLLYRKYVAVQVVLSKVAEQLDAHIVSLDNLVQIQPDSNSLSFYLSQREYHSIRLFIESMVHFDHWLSAHKKAESGVGGPATAANLSRVSSTSPSDNTVFMRRVAASGDMTTTSSVGFTLTKVAGAQPSTAVQQHLEVLSDKAVSALKAVLTFPDGWLCDNVHDADVTGTTSMTTSMTEDGRLTQLGTLRLICMPTTTELLLYLARKTDQACVGLEMVESLVSESGGAQYKCVGTVGLRQLAGQLTEPFFLKAILDGSVLE